ncbi:dihydroorotate dehydrogenase [Anianabacter salinae]|uniref:dihydroorotate dehydrogenase n=1 Tax=Anianabacter salinae TaxID=2851023 RepID=UPI00225E0D01|nr:dihydroorotate dehydrogenase [Anianabacter salinae]MBV0911396.1 dihydroorotate dehydrogenase [Anianabacter salinae]
MTDPRNLDDTELDTLFGAARAQAPQASAALLARVAADADAVLADRTAPAPARPGWLAQIVGGLGGWPSLAGLAAASVAGVFIGFAAPSAVETASGGYIAGDGYDVADFLPSYTDALGDS